MNLDEITDSQGILKQLLYSKEHGTVIGINSQVLGRITYLTGIEDILIDDEYNVSVILRPYDTSGYIFPVRKISLDKIQAVKPFTSKFENKWVEKKIG